MKHYNRNMATCLAAFFFKIVDTRSFRHKALSSVENSVAAALCQQLTTGLLRIALLQLCVDNLRQAC
jgi:hypothetical protein